MLTDFCISGFYGPFYGGTATCTADGTRRGLLGRYGAPGGREAVRHGHTRTGMIIRLPAWRVRTSASGRGVRRRRRSSSGRRAGCGDGRDGPGCASGVVGLLRVVDQLVPGLVVGDRAVVDVGDDRLDSAFHL